MAADVYWQQKELRIPQLNSKGLRDSYNNENTLQVGRFGEFEYYFALIKVLAILAFIGVGIALISGLGPTPAVGLSNLTSHGGFLPNGWKGVWLATTLAITSYMGVEIIAVTAGEAHDPEKTIPRAMKSIVYRLIIFYVAAIAVSRQSAGSMGWR